MVITLNVISLLTILIMNFNRFHTSSITVVLIDVLPTILITIHILIAVRTTVPIKIFIDDVLLTVLTIIHTINWINLVIILQYLMIFF